MVRCELGHVRCFGGVRGRVIANIARVQAVRDGGGMQIPGTSLSPEQCVPYWGSKVSTDRNPSTIPSRNVLMTKREPLTEQDRNEILEYIVSLACRASQSITLRRFYERKLSDALWDWTASGYSRKGNWKNDAYKYCVDTHRSTAESKRADKKELRHEHAVPRNLLVQRIIACSSQPDAVKETLDKFAIAVVITKAEDARLNKKGLRAKMPNDNWWEHDPYARYDECGIKLVQRAGE
jgi:hypothetical protein